MVVILLGPAVALEDFCLQPQLVSSTGEAQTTCLLDVLLARDAVEQYPCFLTGIELTQLH